MREIKFRAWDGEAMVEVAELHLNTKEVLVDDEAWLSMRHSPLMQYTGLHDNNGREIYEGDIVKNEYGDVDVVQYGKQDHEEDYGDRFVYQGWNIQIGSGYPDAVMIEYTVIGNIYENPELMEVAEHER
ncbi:YopX family protein [Lacticaseibacillus suilingensis]|uniref:YopX family protein n=1 Tax=Lacticaseibacillus suilingensis TaxID=2799577 RepID=A0ABW4BHW0_9LACO|nr:YopX family protein [Lacticaseibacillus suilingensis]